MQIEELGADNITWAAVTFLFFYGKLFQNRFDDLDSLQFPVLLSQWPYPPCFLCSSHRSLLIILQSFLLEPFLKPFLLGRSTCVFTDPSIQFSSVQFSSSVVSDSLLPHESQHARPPCPSPTPGVHSNSCLSSRWCHPAISSSVIPFSSCPQPLPASESFPMSQLFSWGGQSIGVSALASFLPKNTQDWSPSEWTGWISLQ